MGTFLLFKGTRLRSTANVPSGPFGSKRPEEVFFDDGVMPPGYQGFELHPKVLQRIRPEVFDQLSSYAELTPEGLKVDGIDTYRERSRRMAIERQQDGILMLAQQVAMFHLAGGVLGDLIPRHQEAYDEAKATLKRAQEELRLLEDGDITDPVPQIFQDLCGKTLQL